MAAFESEVRHLGGVSLPAYSGTRVMMMPFHLHDLGTLPPLLERWRVAVASLIERAPEQHGTGYLTIDEAEVPAGEHHRRPGLHVDGSRHGGWGGNPGPWGGPSGMVVATSVTASQAWHQTFDGEPGPDGDCSHLAPQCRRACRVALFGGQAYWLGPLAVHETLALPWPVRRQFVRVSMPSAAPWYRGYTENPMGVQPTGPILPPRTEQMGWRSR